MQNREQAAPSSHNDIQEVTNLTVQSLLAGEANGTTLNHLNAPSDQASPRWRGMDRAPEAGASVSTGERHGCAEGGRAVIDLGGRRILIVEDEVLIALLLETMIEDLGGVMGANAVSCASALAVLNTDTRGFDAATLDLNLAGEGVEQLVAALEARKIPFIIVTGYQDPELLARFARWPIVFKPIFLNDLSAAFEKLLASPVATSA